MTSPTWHAVFSGRSAIAFHYTIDAVIAVMTKSQERFASCTVTANREFATPAGVCIYSGGRGGAGLFHLYI